jgi:hypothetical protein
VRGHDTAAGWRYRAGAALATLALVTVGVVAAGGTPPAAASPTPTATTLVSSQNPSVSGQLVTFSATVAEVPPGPTPSGSVTFSFPILGTVCQGGSDTVALVSGVAQCVTSLLVADESPVIVTAAYLGDVTDGPSTSSPLSQVVYPASTAVTVTSTAVTPPVTQPSCTTTATSSAVSCPSLAGVTAGASVTDSLGAVPPSDTVATIDHATDTFHLAAAASTSEPGTDSLTFVDDPTSAYPSGHPGRFTVTVAPVPPGTGVPTGTITWTVTAFGGSPTVACSNGGVVRVDHADEATCDIPSGQLLASGTPYSVSAAYSGDANYSSDTGTFSQPVSPSSSKTFLAGSPMPPLHGTPVSFTAAVVPSKYGGPATGTVTFSFSYAPFSLSGCDTTATSITVTCAGALTSLVSGDTVVDTTTPSDLNAGTTVAVVHTNSFTLSSPANLSLAGQTLQVSGTSTAACSGGDSVTLTTSGATCTVPGGLSPQGVVEGVVGVYSGDADDAASTSHTLHFKVH